MLCTGSRFDMSDFIVDAVNGMRVRVEPIRLEIKPLSP